MRIKDVLFIIENHKANDYKRSWNTELGEKGLWSYEHRNKMGLKPSDSNYVVHHKDGNVNNNKKSNLKVVTRAEHARLEKPAQKWTKCKVCGGKVFSKGLCRKCYWKKYHK